jgi:polyhydroxybutyrate depolymerase
VLFHGFSSTAELGAAYTELSRSAPEAGVVLVAPQALGDPSSWRILDPSGADRAFIDRMIAEMAASACIDESRVWLAGFSAGSAMAALYGCLRETPVSGMMLASGLAPPLCPADATPDVLITHGTADPVVPFGGGEQTINGTSVALDSIPASAAAWAEKAGCDEEPDVRTVGDDVEVRTWLGCSGGTKVELSIVEGGGHTWPGAPVESLGPTTRTYEASCVLLRNITGAGGDAYEACPGDPAES